MMERVRLKQPRGITILDCLDDPNIFAPFFKSPKTWGAWRTFLAALFGLALSQSQADTFRECTGRQQPPVKAAREGYLIIGRRGGKSFVLALIGVFLACFRDYRKYLAPGERATVMVIASDRKQARTVLRYVKGLLNVAMLRQVVVHLGNEYVDLQHRVTIEVHTSSFKSIRGYTVVAALFDELAFWPTDDRSSDPDFEVLNAVRPGMATIPNGLLLCASSPYARKGVLYDAYRKHFGKDGDILVWQAPTRTMNPSIPQALIERELDRDRAYAEAEYLAQFRSDIESFIKLDEVERCVSVGVSDRPPLAGCRYRAFVDPSGGSNDSMTLAIAHKQGTAVVLDRVIERKPPFSPASVVEEFAAILKLYGVSKIEGDRYAGEWPREQFRKQGITYEIASKAKSDLYVAFLPLLTSQMVELVDQPRLIQQIVGLERRTARGGRDSIDHAPNGHDDLANVVAGVCAMFAKLSNYDTSLAWVGDTPLNFQREEQLMLNRYLITGGMR